MKKTTFIICTLFLIACGTTKKMAASKEKPAEGLLTENDAGRAAQKFPGTTLADLTQGKSLYEQNCQRCHDLKKPTSRNEGEWRDVVPPMARKSHIDANTENLILRYVVTMCSTRNG